MKQVDWRMIHELQDDARMPLSAISKKIGVSVPTLRKRLDLLKNDGLIDATILLNPGAIRHGMMVIFSVLFPKITTEEQYVIQNRIREVLEDNFWVSWKVADRPMLLLAFQAGGPSEVHDIRQTLSSILGEGEILREIAGGEIEYFPDFRRRVIEERSC